MGAHIGRHCGWLPRLVGEVADRRVPRPKTINNCKRPTAMRIFIFKSEARPALHAFAGDESGSALPVHHGPWTVTGIIGPHAVPPHGIARKTVEQAIAMHGFQMWRLAKKATVDA